MKKLALLLSLLCALNVQAQTYWDGTADKNFPGEGTEASPYLISTPEQLAGLAERTNVDKEDFAGKYIKLTADIYLTNYNDPNQEQWKEWHPIAHEWKPISDDADYGYFRGHFDGDGHTIYNLYYNGGAEWGSDWDPDDPDFNIDEFLEKLDQTAWSRGLFANLDGGTIENLNLSGAHMNGIGNVALLVVHATKGSVIRNCHVQGEFRGYANYMGGIVSDNEGLIENCSANVNITPVGGGIIAHTNKTEGVIRNCSAAGSIYATATSTGCFVDTNEGLIEKCSSSAGVTALRGKQENNKIVGHNAGGFLYYNYGIVRECSATGNVTVNSHVGADGGSAGFCYMNLGLIESCYSTGNVISSGDDEAGVAQFAASNGAFGSVQEGYPVIRNCFSTGHIIYTDAANNRRSTGSFSYHTNGKTYHDFARHTFCWFNADGMPTPAEGWEFNATLSGWRQEELVMKSQAFVDTLNLCASFLGTSQWELKDGIPQPTGVYIKNTTAFFDGGEGTKESPYLISNKKQLENFRWLVHHGYDFMNEYVLQTADIELNVPKEQWAEVEPEVWIPIGIKHSFPGFPYSLWATEEFMGNYNGGFHEVKNLCIDNNKEDQGFFGYVGASTFDNQQPVVIQNLGVTDAYMEVTGTSGILAASVGNGGILKQCWTSGKIETLSGWGTFGALIGSNGLNGLVLNCSSSARLIGKSNDYYGRLGSIWGGYSHGVIENDILVNYLFTGSINRDRASESDYRGIYQHGYNSENVYEDGEKANITGDDYGTPGGVRSTAWLQSKEYVNLLNAAVERWNAENDEAKQLNFWQWNENDYPKVSPNAEYNPGYTVTFESNGGSEVVAVKVVSGSTIQSPERPRMVNYLFAGWYKDEQLTTIFKFGQDLVEEDMTLYAKWLEDTRFDYDITPFSNKYATTYHIQTAAQLRGFAYLQNGVWQDAAAIEEPRDFSEKTIVLDNDIFLNDTTDWQEWGKDAYAVPWRSIGTVTNNYQPNNTIQFKGTFDGQGHVIYGLYVERGGLPSLEFGGLFYRVGDGATICNLGIEASVLNLQELNPEGQTDDERWYYYGDGSYNTDMVGMLADWFGSETTISQCYTQGKIYMPTSTDQAGALTGRSASSTSNCYARVDIYQKNYSANVGGFMYEPDEYLNMTNCYNAGKVNDGMGRAGYGLHSGINSYYFDNELISNEGFSYSILKNRGRTTAEMKQKATYEGWDFDTVWGISSILNDGYPFLRQFHPDAPSITIIAKSYTREYGEANPTFEFTSEGEELVGTPVITCEATATSPVGEYPIVISKGSVTNDNETFVNGVLKITKAPLTIAAKSYSIKQGKDLPQYELEYSGFKNNETKNALSKQPTVTCEASAFSLPGVYDILVSGAEATNYEISYEKGTLTITPFKKGDVNNDGYVDVADLTGVVHFILNESTANLVFDSADMDESGAVEINDYAALVKLILNSPKTNASMARRSPANLEDLISLSSNEGGEIFVSLLENRQFTGLQFDLVLPEGVTLAENGTRSESPQHGCWSARHEDGEYRILCSSMSNAELNEGLILRLKTNGHNGGGVSVSNVVLSDIYSSRHEAASAETLLNNTTAIAQVTCDDLTIRTAKGTLSLLSNRDQTVIIYGANGIKISEVKLSAGQANSIKLPSGVYVINNKKAAVQ